MDNDSQFWQQHLEPKETLLWHGQPQGNVRFLPSGGKRLIVGLAFTLMGGAMLWLGPDQASFNPVGKLAFYAVTVFLALFGLYWLLLDWFVDAWLRRHTRYAITNQRALVLRRTLKAYPITNSSPIAIWDRDPKSVIFAQVEVTTRTTTIAKIGFHALDNPAHVLAVLNRVKATVGQ